MQFWLNHSLNGFWCGLVSSDSGEANSADSCRGDLEQTVKMLSFAAKSARLPSGPFGKNPSALYDRMKAS